MDRRGGALVLIFSFLVAGLGGLPGAPAAQADAEVGVTVSNFQFTPETVTIDPGDSVRWTWVSGFHNVETSDGSQEWCSTRSSGDCVRTFPEAGTFAYRCGIHPGDMQGTITVRGTDPVLTIDTPGEGEVVEGTFTASGTATHPQAIDAVYWRLDGSVPTQVHDIVETPEGVAWSVAIDTTARPNGPRTLSITASSADGGESTAQVGVVIDNPQWVDLSADLLRTESDLLSARLSAVVTNHGNIDVADVVILFEYAHHGTWRTIATMQGGIVAKDQVEVAVEWPSDGKLGAFDVRVRIDPDGLIDETDGTNNEATGEAAFVTPLLPGTDPFDP